MRNWKANLIKFGLVLTALLSANLVFCSNATDTISTTCVLSVGDTVISSGGSFELGFFNLGNSRKWYVGIWYKKITAFTVVWVANRDDPLTNSSGATLTVTVQGTLVLRNGSDDIIWWSSNKKAVAQYPVAQLLDTGNLVVREAYDENPDNYLWESFDYPTDTLLPGMKLGRNLVTGHDVYLTAWRTNDDPATGDYTYRLDTAGYPQIFLRRGSNAMWRWSDMPGLRKNTMYTSGIVLNSKEVYVHYELLNSSVITRLTMNQTGVVQRWTWLERTQSWALHLILPVNTCDIYSRCGAYASCHVGNSSICVCLKKFTPRLPEEWMRGDWSDGCVRGTQLNCQTDGFVKYSGIKLPDTSSSWFSTSMTLEECRVMCLKNCSCMAYSNLNISRGGSGCLVWYGDLVDIKYLYPDGQDIYIRMSAWDLDFDIADSKRKAERVLIICLSSGGTILLGFSLIVCVKKRKTYLRLMKGGWHKENHNKNLELPLFDFSTVSKATDNFSLTNKLGEGGFGPVYKGTLEDGQDIALKRLSKTSMQGNDEFKNEVVFIAKLQHRNLVKILGCCIQGEEKMVIYEYMPNGSLDLILFDDTKNKLLDWPKRIHIVNGIARGLRYLHQDSRLRIIHRDLKASNILVDAEMNPKISDFGIARSFGGNEIGAQTSRVVGTFGYMSPEYAIDGLFSVKSDVFSFGVLVLEILSGKRNRGFSHRDHHHSLLGHAWLLYKEGRSLELVDSKLDDSFYISKVLKVIHVGLLCVQQYPKDRPSMSSVVFMLENEVELPQPNQPGFFTERDAFGGDTSNSTNIKSSTNDITITLPQPR